MRQPEKTLPNLEIEQQNQIMFAKEWISNRGVHLSALPRLVGMNGFTETGWLIAHNLITNPSLKYVVIIGSPGSWKTTEGEDCEKIIRAKNENIPFIHYNYEETMDTYVRLFGDDDKWPLEGRSGLYRDMSRELYNELQQNEANNEVVHSEGMIPQRTIYKTEMLFTVHDRAISTFRNIARQVNNPNELLVIANVTNPLIQDIAVKFRSAMTKYKEESLPSIHKKLQQELQLFIHFEPGEEGYPAPLTLNDIKTALVHAAERAASKQDIENLNRETYIRVKYVVDYLQRVRLYDIYDHQISFPRSIRRRLSGEQRKRMKEEAIVLMFMLNNQRSDKAWKINANVFQVLGQPIRGDSIYIQIPPLLKNG